MAGLKLSKLPDRTPVKITVHLPPELKPGARRLCRSVQGDLRRGGADREAHPGDAGELPRGRPRLRPAVHEGGQLMSMTGTGSAIAEPISVKIPEAARLTGPAGRGSTS